MKAVIIVLLIATAVGNTFANDLTAAPSLQGTNFENSIGLNNGTVSGKPVGNAGIIHYAGNGSTNGTAYDIKGVGNAGTAAALDGGSNLLVNKTGAYGNMQGIHRVAGFQDSETAAVDATRDGTNVFANVLTKLGALAG